MNTVQKNIFIFDVDGTLTESKSDLQQDMADALCTLFTKGYIIAVTSGGNFKQFNEQFLSHLKCDGCKLDEIFSKLYLLPTSGAHMYAWNIEKHDWDEVYALRLNESEKGKIFGAFKNGLQEVSFEIPKAKWGAQLEDRDTAITFSAFGQYAPVEEKKKWDPNNYKKLELVEKLKQYIPEFEVRTGGMTSIDITAHGINKGYGVRRLLKYLGKNISDGVFFGDALHENGNDFPVIATGMDTVAVTGPEDTIKKLKKYL